MAIYRNVSMSFWTDTKVIDDFTPEDKYFYLYLFTNPHTNLSGCYEISIKQIATEMGYSKDSVESLIERFKTIHRIIDYSKDTKEILIINWHKYNWNRSEKFIKALKREIEDVKCDSFKEYLSNVLENDNEKYPMDTVSIPYQYPMDTTVTVTDNTYLNFNNKVNDNDTLNNTNNIYNKNIGYKNNISNIINKYNISDNLKQCIDDWIEYKLECNFRYKDRGAETLIKTIVSNASQYGDEAVENAIQESIASGYKGIVFDKIGRNKPKNTAEMLDDFYDMTSRWAEKMEREEQLKNDS